MGKKLEFLNFPKVENGEDTYKFESILVFYRFFIKKWVFFRIFSNFFPPFEKKKKLFVLLLY